jgi:hypothetical protein
MKKRYLTILATILSFASFAQNGNFVNGGFENWTNTTLYEYPTQWFTSNQEQWMGVETILKSTDAVGGIYSCEINASQVGQDTTFGYVLQGSIGPMGPDGGIPYTADFDEVKFEYKSDIPVGDTLFLLAIQYNLGAMVQMELVQAAIGTNASWTSGSVAITNVPHDELFIGFVMGNPWGNTAPTPGSWARVDEVEMYYQGVATTNIPDPGFENWSAQTVEAPDNWHTLNEELSAMGVENVTKSTDANSGMYSAEIETVQEPQNGDTIPGFLSWGDINMFGGNPFNMVPYNATPSTFSAYYQYAPSGLDGGMIMIEFFSGGMSVGQHQFPVNPSATWTQMTYPLTISSQPDSILFLAFSGDNPGSILMLDDMELSGGDVSLEEFGTMNVNIYPNPASDIVFVKAEGVYTYSIIDLAGNVITTQSNVSGAQKIDVNDLAAGTYIVKINNSITSENHKLIVK